MNFPIKDLLDREASQAWLVKYFHQDQFGCPRCQQPVSEARSFRTTKKKSTHGLAL